MSNRTHTGMRAAICSLLIVGMPYLAFSQVTPTADVAFLVVRVPADAKVLIAGEATTATGTERTFVTPALKAGRKYSYVVIGTWSEGGKEKRVERTVHFKAGDSSTVDLTQPEAVKSKVVDKPKVMEKPKVVDKPKDKPKVIEKPKEDLKGAERLKAPKVEDEKKRNPSPEGA